VYSEDSECLVRVQSCLKATAMPSCDWMTSHMYASHVREDDARNVFTARFERSQTPSFFSASEMLHGL
jgi:hypothetical protein